MKKQLNSNRVTIMGKHSFICKHGGSKMLFHNPISLKHKTKLLPNTKLNHRNPKGHKLTREATMPSQFRLVQLFL